MNKHELIVAIQAKQEAKGLSVVQSYDLLNRYRLDVLQDTFTNLSDSFSLDIDAVKTILTSLQQTGGCTYSPSSNETNTTKGYMVALIGYEYVINNVWNTLGLKHVLNFWLAKIGYHKTFNKHTYIGLWINDDKLYIDLTENVDNRDIAIQLGKDRKQLAIWDCANGVAIDTKPITYPKIDADILTDKKY